MHKIRSQAKRKAWSNRTQSTRTNRIYPRRHAGSAPNLSTDNQNNSRDHYRTEDQAGIEAGFQPPSALIPITGTGTTNSENFIQRIRRKLPSGKTPRPHYTLLSQIQHVLLPRWITLVLYPFIPAGFVVQYLRRNAVTVFAVNFVAIFPAVIVLADAADELILRTGDNMGALINATFSNAAQFITTIFLLRDNQIDILKTTLIGNILSSMHLMLGLSFLFGGVNKIQQFYNVTVARISSTLLLLAMVSVILPTMGKYLADVTDPNVVKISRGISVIHIFVYIIYLFFQLKTHSNIYDEPSTKVPARRQKAEQPVPEATDQRILEPGELSREALAPEAQQGEVMNAGDEEIDRVPKLARRTLAIVLVVYTTILTFNTAFATNSLQGLIDETGLSPTFIGIVILPLLSNDVTVIGSAMLDKMDLCVAMTVGKCLQTVLLIIPFSILLGWIIHRDMSLNFDAFEVVALFASVIYINSMIQDGKSTYLDGVLLLSVFLIICLTSFWVP